MDSTDNMKFLNYIKDLNNDLMFDNIFNLKFLFTSENDVLKTALDKISDFNSSVTIEEYLHNRIASFQIPTNSAEILTEYLHGNWLHTSVRKSDDNFQLSFFETEDTAIKKIFQTWIKMTTPEFELFPNEYSGHVIAYPINGAMESNTSFEFEYIAPFEVNDIVIDLTKELSVKIITVSFNYRNSDVT